MNQIYEVSLPAREVLKLELNLSAQNEIESAKLTGIGCTECLKTLKEYRPHLVGNVENLPLPEGIGHASVLLRELILKAKGQWKFPVTDEEVCHCRSVATAIVDQAIISGCHKPKDVSRTTGASTSCGTCRPDVERMIEYRLKGI